MATTAPAVFLQSPPRAPHARAARRRLASGSRVLLGDVRERRRRQGSRGGGRRWFRGRRVRAPPARAPGSDTSPSWTPDPPSGDATPPPTATPARSPRTPTSPCSAPACGARPRHDPQPHRRAPPRPRPWTPRPHGPLGTRRTRVVRPRGGAQNRAGLGTLLRRAEDGYRGAWEHAGVDVDGPMGAHAPTPDAADEPFAARRGYVLLQRDVRSAAAAASSARSRREGLGGDALAMEAIDQAGVLELEPNLRPEAATGGAWWFPDGWFLRDPPALLRAHGRRVRRRGG